VPHVGNGGRAKRAIAPVAALPRPRTTVAEDGDPRKRQEGRVRPPESACALTFPQTIFPHRGCPGQRCRPTPAAQTQPDPPAEPPRRRNPRRWASAPGGKSCSVSHSDRNPHPDLMQTKITKAHQSRPHAARWWINDFDEQPTERSGSGGLADVRPGGDSDRAQRTARPDAGERGHHERRARRTRPILSKRSASKGRTQTA
jgi:hypothetical protein